MDAAGHHRRVQDRDGLLRGAAQDAKPAGFEVEVISRSPATHTAFADQLGIVEDFISRNVDAIAISPADTEAIKPAIKQANQADIPVIMVNLLEEQDDIEVASYIGFDNAEAAMVSAYAVLDYYGGPGVLGAGEKVDVKPDDYLDLKWWEETYADADKERDQGQGLDDRGHRRHVLLPGPPRRLQLGVEQYPGVRSRASRSRPTGTARRASRRPRTSCRATRRTR